MPYPMQRKIKNLATMVETVSYSINKKLKPYIKDGDKRLDLCIDICDDIIRNLRNGKLQ